MLPMKPCPLQRLCSFPLQHHPDTSPSHPPFSTAKPVELETPVSSTWPSSCLCQTSMNPTPPKARCLAKGVCNSGHAIHTRALRKPFSSLIGSLTTPPWAQTLSTWKRLPHHPRSFYQGGKSFPVTPEDLCHNWRDNHSYTNHRQTVNGVTMATLD